jgi:hypothetical protein
MSGLDVIERHIMGLEDRFGRVAAMIIVVAGIVAISFFLAFPMQILISLWGHIGGNIPNERFNECYMPLSINPWHAQITNPKWQAFRARLLGPLIAWSTGLRGRACVLVPLAANPIFCGVAFSFFRKKYSAGVAALAATILALTLACVTSQIWAGFQDSLACLFLLLAMLATSPILSALCILLGMLADERILAAALLVLFWHGLRQQSAEDRRRDLITRAAWIAAAAACWAIFAAIQIHVYKISLLAVYRATHDNFLNYKSDVWIGWYYGLRGAWILPAAVTAWWVMNRQYRIAAFFLVGIIPVLLVAIQVQDISRVSSIAFPAFIISVVVLYQVRPQLTKDLLIASLIVQVVTPIITVVSAEHRSVQPFPLVMADELIGHYRPLGPNKGAPSQTVDTAVAAPKSVDQH